MNDPLFPIPFHCPSLGSEEQEEVLQVLASGWLTSGPKAAQFEEEFRVFANARRAVAVSSGTAGLHVAMEGLGIGPGDEVITTPLTFCATVQSIVHAGAKPVLADVGSDGNLNPDSVAALVGPRTRAIVPVHLGGLPCDLAKLWSIARAHDLLVIEDAAHAVGSRYNGNRITAAGHWRERSFYSDSPS
jgi:dTDP-4-amino-4,6-dideoxygalactose transaminase